MFAAAGVVLLALIYSVAVLLAPLPSATAVITAKQRIVGSTAQLTWPGVGNAAVGAVGHDGLLARNGANTAVPIASMTKTITAQVILQKKPIAKGSQGPTITFTDKDVAIFNQVVAEGGSWAPVVAGEKLTEKQSIEAMMLPSANNYAISLAIWAFGSVDSFLTAANAWLKGHNFSDTHLTDPAGLDPGTVSTPADLVGIGKLLLASPVLASVVKTKSVTLDGAGTQGNGNKLLGQDGIDGIKTGFTDEAGHCLLFSAKAKIGGHAVTLVGVVLGQPAYSSLWATVPPLLTSAKNGFHSVTLTGANTSFGSYTTRWGARSTLVSTSAPSLLTWSNTPITVKTQTQPMRAGAAGDTAGTVTFAMGKTTISRPLKLADEIPDPGFWWRFTHPFALLG